MIEDPAIQTQLSELTRLRTPAWVFDIDHRRVIWANPAALDVWRATSLADLCDRDMGADMSPAVAHRLTQYQQDFVRQNAQFLETWTLYPKGQPCTLNVVFSGFPLADGRMAMFCEALGDHHGDPETLRSLEALVHTSVMITLYNRAGRALYRNAAARDAVADADSGIRGSFVKLADYRSMLRTLVRHGQARQIALIQTARGERWHEVSARLCRDPVSGASACLVTEVDVTELKRTEARAHYLAHHDTLTGLANRHFVHQGFAQRLEEARQSGQQAALIFIDLDRFKHINDSLGHAAGDQLLVTMAQRLQAVTRASDMVARLGGDEFLVLAVAPDINHDVDALGQRILTTMGRPLMLGATEVRVSPSLGVCLFPDDGDALDDLMRHADMAMYRAKEQGRNRMAYFTADLQTRAQGRLAMEQELRDALALHQFELFYQPRLNVESNVIVGAEALIRWHHPRRGLVMPGEFIGLCEEAGLIHALGATVLEQAARQQVQWARRGYPLRVSVNLSPKQFGDPDLLRTIETIVRKTGCNPQLMELEITESVLLGHDEATINTLHALCDMGFRLAIDDFGTGYSNLAYLQLYPINCLKIDRSFVQALGTVTPIADLIITMCGMLQMDMVAEGVETEAQLAWLRDRHCHEYQGFLFSKAVPVSEFDALLTRQTQRSPGR